MMTVSFSVPSSRNGAIYGSVFYNTRKKTFLKEQNFKVMNSERNYRHLIDIKNKEEGTK